MPPRRTDSRGQSTLSRTMDVQKPAAANGILHKPPVLASPAAPANSAGQESKELSEKEQAELVERLTRSPQFAETYSKMVASQQAPAFHVESLDKVDRLLRSFDMAMSYGPCSGITRLQRYERACKLQQSPPPVVGELLRSPLGGCDRYRWSYIH